MQSILVIELACVPEETMEPFAKKPKFVSTKQEESLLDTLAAAVNAQET